MKRGSAEDSIGKAVENLALNPRPRASIAGVGGLIGVGHQFLIDRIRNVGMPVVGSTRDEDGPEKDEGNDRGHGQRRHRAANARQCGGCDLAGNLWNSGRGGDATGRERKSQRSFRWTSRNAGHARGALNRANFLEFVDAQRRWAGMRAPAAVNAGCSVAANF